MIESFSIVNIYSTLQRKFNFLKRPYVFKG